MQCFPDLTQKWFVHNVCDVCNQARALVRRRTKGGLYFKFLESPYHSLPPFFVLWNLKIPRHCCYLVLCLLEYALQSFPAMNQRELYKPISDVVSKVRFQAKAKSSSFIRSYSSYLYRPVSLSPIGDKFPIFLSHVVSQWCVVTIFHRN